MNRQKLPLVLMLIAGAVTSLTVYSRNLGLKTMLIALLASFIAFYIIGELIRMALDNIDKKNEVKEVSDEGEVIEKAPDADGEPNDESSAASSEEKVEEVSEKVEE